MRTITSLALIGLALGLSAGATAQPDAKKTLNEFDYSYEYPQRVSPIKDAQVHSPLLQPVKLAPETQYRPGVVIQVGAFQDYSNARKRAERLSGYGQTRIVDADEFGRRLYRVYLGDFQDKASARPTLNRIRAKGFDGFVKTP